MQLTMSQDQEQRTIPQQIVYLFRYSQTEFTRFSSAVAMLGWSVTLAWPGDTIANTPSLWYLQWSSDGFWSFLMLLLSIVLGASAVYEWTRVHAIGLLFAMVWWMYLALSILISCVVRDVPASTGIPTYATFAIGAAWAFLRYMARHDVIRRRRE